MNRQARAGLERMRLSVVRGDHDVTARLDRHRPEELDRRGVARVARGVVRAREELWDERAAWRDAFVHVPGATAVLNGGEAGHRRDDDGAHRACSKRTRSPNARVAPRTGSNATKSMAVPIKLQPPADAQG